MNKTITLFLALITLVGNASAATNSGAANDTTNTTLSNAITAVQVQNIAQVCLASGTGVVVRTATQNGSLLLVDGEMMQVISNPVGTCYSVNRGVNGTPASTHNSGAFVWVGAAAASSGDSSRPYTPGAFISYAPTGSCIPQNQYTLPLILVSEAAGYRAGGTPYMCWAASATASGNWAPMTSVYYGGTSASVAGLQVLTGTAMTISGTNAITGFTAPNGWPSGQCLEILPTGAFTTTTATNIAKASTAVANVTLFECWNGSKWVPSY